MKKIVLIYLFFLTAFVALAQPGTLDATFNPTDAGFGKGDGANATVLAIASLSNGKTLIAGWFQSYNGKPCGRLARLNSDGTLDETFNQGGDGANNGINAVVVLPDGKILIGGHFSSYNGKAHQNLARLNNDGSLDETFNQGGSGARGEIYSIVLQQVGQEIKILIAGDVFEYNGVRRNYMARLNADGTLDATFHYQNGANSSIYAIALQGDGKIMIGGRFTNYNGVSITRLARLNTDGTVDNSFITGVGANDFIRTITVQSTQQGEKILVGGIFTNYSNSNRKGLVRLNNDGSLDGTFDPSGTGINKYIFNIVMQTDGKILIGGEFSQYSGSTCNNMARLNANGTLDEAFNPGQGPSGSVYAIVQESNGKILIGGFFFNYNNRKVGYITRLHENSNHDITFNPVNGANNGIYAKAFQNRQLLIAGSFTAFNNISVGRIARLNEDGTLDPTFNTGGMGANGDIRDISLLSNGKILITGYFTEYNGKSVKYLARLNADGTLDESFNNGGNGVNHFISTHAVLSNGKIVIAGSFNEYNGLRRQRLARLNNDGSLDTDFDPGASVGFDWIYFILPQGEKIIIGGNFLSYQNIPRNRITRINADGNLDLSFNTAGIGTNQEISKMIAQPDGKILIAGWFTTYNGVSRNYLARLHPDGTLDESFAVGSGLDNIVNSFAIQRDGKVLIGGNFTQYNGIPRINLARLQPNGALDETFDPKSGANSDIYTLAIQEDGHIIIGGNFTSYDGTGRNRLARIKGDNHTITLQAPVSTQFCPGSPITVTYTKTGFYRLTNQFSLQLSDAFGSFTNATTIGTANTSEAGNITATIPVNITPGSGYRIRILSSLPALVSASNATDLTIAATASITTQPLPQTLCAGSAASFSVAATGSGLTYQWQKDGAAIAGATAASYGIPSVAASNAGNYQVVVTGTCGTATSQAVALTVNAMPAIPVISASGNTLSSSANTSNQWFLNSTPISSATGNTHQVTTSGTYTVQVSQNGCTSTSAPYQFVATAISGPGLWNGEVSLFPNPVFNQLNLRNVGGRKLSIQLFDIHGKTVRQWYTAQTTAILDVTGLAGGVYQLVLTDAAKNTSISQTIIKR